MIEKHRFLKTKELFYIMQELIHKIKKMNRKEENAEIKVMNEEFIKKLSKTIPTVSEVYSMASEINEFKTLLRIIVVFEYDEANSKNKAESL
jgi:hypothetical protein